MKFFLDTANLNEIREVASTGILDGITTNPTLISKEGNPFEEQLIEICKIVDGPVSAETVSLDAQGMVGEGRHLSKLHKNIVIKCPFTREGLKATKMLSDEGIRVNVTLIFSAPQALMAAKAGAKYCSIVHDAVAHPGDMSGLAKGVLDRVITQADVVATLSSAVALQLREGGQPPDRIVTVFHPDLTYGPKKPRRPRDPKAPMPLLHLGRIMAYTGLGLFVDMV